MIRNRLAELQEMSKAQTSDSTEIEMKPIEDKTMNSTQGNLSQGVDNKNCQKIGIYKVTSFAYISSLIINSR